jgi:hypothetical protein
MTTGTSKLHDCPGRSPFRLLAAPADRLASRLVHRHVGRLDGCHVCMPACLLLALQAGHLRAGCIAGTTNRLPLPMPTNAARSTLWILRMPLSLESTGVFPMRRIGEIESLNRGCLASRLTGQLAVWPADSLVRLPPGRHTVHPSCMLASCLACHLNRQTAGWLDSLLASRLAIRPLCRLASYLADWPSCRPNDNAACRPDGMLSIRLDGWPTRWADCNMASPQAGWPTRR